jgi:hypothetical protein
VLYLLIAWDPGDGCVWNVHELVARDLEETAKR